MEEWQKITSFSNYSVSSDGRIRNDKTARFLSMPLDNYGYPSVHLTQNGNERVVRVHRLVMESFSPPVDKNKKQVNHINGIKSDNRKVNLEWTTAKENIEHSIKNGLVGPHSGGVPMKLKPSEVWLIRKLLKSKTISIRKIAKMFRVSYVTIYNIRDGICYSTIGLEEKRGIT